MTTKEGDKRGKSKLPHHAEDPIEKLRFRDRRSNDYHLLPDVHYAGARSTVTNRALVEVPLVRQPPVGSSTHNSMMSKEMPMPITNFPRSHLPNTATYISNRKGSIENQ